MCKNLQELYTNYVLFELLLEQRYQKRNSTLPVLFVVPNENWVRQKLTTGLLLSLFGEFCIRRKRHLTSHSQQFPPIVSGSWEIKVDAPRPNDN